MRTLDNEKYERIKGEIERALFRYSFHIDSAVEEYDNIDDVIECILDDYYEVYGDERDAIPWLEENITTVNYYMRRGELNECESIYELACETRYLEAKESLLKVKDKIQELIDLVLRPEDEEDDDDDDDEY